jgi:hypothetical protein
MSDDINAITSYISRRLDEVSAEDDIPIPLAWARVSAEMLGYDPDSVEFFPNRDCGIDYYSRSDRSFEVFQCKMHDPDDAGNLNIKAPFGPDGYVDLQRAYLFLSGSTSPTNIDSRLLSFREQIKEEMSLVPAEEDEETPKTPVTLTFRLITLGDALSPAAKDQARILRKQLKAFEKSNAIMKLSLEHTGLTELSEFFQSPESSPREPEPIRLRLAYHQLKFDKPDKAEIKSSNFVTFYTPAVDLVTAARKEGVSLFDANVRYELSSSNINQEIRASASHPKTMKLFHLYNNGVTVTGSGWSYRDQQSSVEIRNPFVINGCQTVRSLARVQKELEEQSEDNPYPLSAFQESCLVLVRLINRDIVNPDDLVRAANTQNAMEPRNLLGNRTEQRMLEKELQEYGWFYERKDGALDALKESKRTSFGTPINVFQIRREKKVRKVIRSCDNREVARRWLSFFGYSDEGKNQRRQHFPTDGKGLYTKIFRSYPVSHRDVVVFDSSSGIESTMKEGRPPAGWVLYSYHLFELIKRLLPVASRLRSRIRKELKESGKEPSLTAVNERMLSSENARLSFGLSMLDHVVLELCGFAMARALGEKWLSPGPAKRALELGTIGEFHRFADFPPDLLPESILELQEDLIRKDPALIAIRLAVQAIDSTLRQPEFTSSFLASERKSRYLESEALVRAYAEKVDLYDKYFSSPENFTKWWKSGSPILAMRKLLLQ